MDRIDQTFKLFKAIELIDSVQNHCNPKYVEDLETCIMKISEIQLKISDANYEVIDI